MATSKYTKASAALPWARLVLADETRDAIGVSDGISEGERHEAKGEARRTAPRAAVANLVIMMVSRIESIEMFDVRTARGTSGRFDWFSKPWPY